MIRRRIVLSLVAAWTATLVGTAAQASCDTPHQDASLQDEGRISAILDARTLRLDDGREVRLSGIEIPAVAGIAGTAWLRDHALEQKITLRGNDTPDRYGRQHAFVFIAGDGATLQSALVAEGHAIVSASPGDETCMASLKQAELSAESSRLGVWARPEFVLTARATDDLLKQTGRFRLVEGKILSARQVGTMLYLNFDKRRIQGFAVTISRRMMPAFAAAGMTAATLTGRRVRVRGWISQHGGPRMEARLPGQIEFISDTRTRTAGDR
jgi:endonuclease YncB( thermonuclease family)